MHITSWNYSISRNTSHNSDVIFIYTKCYHKIYGNKVELILISGSEEEIFLTVVPVCALESSMLSIIVGKLLAEQVIC